MIRHNDIKQMSLSQFSGPEGIGRYNSITNDPSILTSYLSRLKSSECAPDGNSIPPLDGYATAEGRSE